MRIKANGIVPWWIMATVLYAAASFELLLDREVGGSSPGMPFWAYPISTCAGGLALGILTVATVRRIGNRRSPAIGIAIRPNLLGAQLIAVAIGTTLNHTLFLACRLIVHSL